MFPLALLLHKTAYFFFKENSACVFNLSLDNLKFKDLWKNNFIPK